MTYTAVPLPDGRWVVKDPHGVIITGPMPEADARAEATRRNALHGLAPAPR